MPVMLRKSLRLKFHILHAQTRWPGTLRSLAFFLLGAPTDQLCEESTGKGRLVVVLLPDGRKVWKTLWAIQVPENVKVFAWKIANNGILTQANKCYRHIVEQATCEMCGHEK
jgi:hypothetical protein